MSRKVPASEYMGYDKYIGDEEDMVVDIPIKHESKPYLMIPFPDNATNGDVIKALFKGRDLSVITERLEHTHWWNAPYKAEGEDKE